MPTRTTPPDPGREAAVFQAHLPNTVSAITPPPREAQALGHQAHPSRVAASLLATQPVTANQPAQPGAAACRSTQRHQRLASSPPARGGGQPVSLNRSRPNSLLNLGKRPPVSSRTPYEVSALGNKARPQGAAASQPHEVAARGQKPAQPGAAGCRLRSREVVALGRKPVRQGRQPASLDVVVHGQSACPTWGSGRRLIAHDQLLIINTKHCPTGY